MECLNRLVVESIDKILYDSVSLICRIVSRPTLIIVPPAFEASNVNQGYATPRNVIHSFQRHT